MAGTVYTPYVAATLNGTPITGVRKARVVSSFSDPVTKIYVSVYPAIDWSEGDTLAVTMGSGTNNVLSGTGQLYETDYLNSGPSFELVARGPLFKAQKYRNNQADGLTLTNLTGGPATDEAIVKAVLDVVGVSYTPSNIGGTGLQRGTLAPAAYTWRMGESALDYLNRIGKASLGYRLVETIGGDVVRVQVRGRPSSAADFSLEQGVDIFAGGHTQFDAFGRYSAVTVNGYDYGDGNGAVTYSWPIPIPAGTDTYVYTSDMIERGYESDPRGGISAANIALSFVLPEVDRIAIRVSGIKTPRDDLFEPGQTHQINSSYLGLDDELLWCMAVTRECDDKWFTQTTEYIGGGTATDGFIQPYGQSTFPYVLRVPPRQRLRDYTYLYSAQIPNLVGKDAMVPGVQSTVSRSPQPVRQQPQNERAHAGILGAGPP